MVHGRLTRRPHLLVIGGALLVIGGAIIFAPLGMRGWEKKLVPTGVLISQVIDERGFAISEWKELNTRTLSLEQELRLATGLIDKRRERAWLPADDDNWLVAQIVAGTLPAELRDRYYQEMLDLTLVAPSTAKVGQEIKLAVKGTYRGASSMNPSAAMYVGGYFINNDPQPINRQVSPMGGIMVDPTKARQSRQNLDATIKPDVAGKCHVRFEVWIVALPFAQGPPIQWRADNTPVIPPTAAWFEKRVLEHVIQVEP